MVVGLAIQREGVDGFSVVGSGSGSCGEEGGGVVVCDGLS